MKLWPFRSKNDPHSISMQSGSGTPIEEVDRAIPQLPEESTWLADSPIFIDEKLIDDLHDVVVKPIGFEYRDEEVEKEVSFGSESGKQTGFKSSISLSPFSLFDISPIKPSFAISRDTSETETRSETTRYQRVHTPLRQMIQILLRYDNYTTNRLYFEKNPTGGEWLNPEQIKETPREIVVLDLAGYFESQQDDSITSTMFIPVAAEFANGEVVTFSDKLATKREKPPSYPRPHSGRYKKKKQEYWDWFEDNYDSMKAMQVVEEAAQECGRIQWIDYRLPITKSQTLGFHISPSEEYNTGEFSYQFIERGYRYGIRAVGLMKSSPTMDVMAIYNK